MWRFGFRFLLIVAIGTSTLLAEDRPNEEEAIAQIKQLGGMIEVDQSRQDRPVNIIALRNIDHLDEHNWRLLRAFRHLTTLYVDRTEITREGLNVLRELESLKILSIRIPINADSDLSELKTLTNLTTLHLAGKTNDNDGIKGLGELTSLTNLTVELPRISVGDAKEFRTLKNLVALSLQKVQRPVAVLSHLTGLQNLRRLNLSGEQLTDPGLIPLNNLTQLRTLSVWGNQLTGASLQNIINLKNLDSLSFYSEVALTDDDIRGIGEMQNLKELSLGCSQFTDSAWNEFTQLQQLRVLAISGIKGRRSGAKPIGRMTDAGMKELKKLKQLEKLDISGQSEITDAGIQEIVELKNLQTLRLRYLRNLTVNGILALRELKSLKVVRTANNDKLPPKLKQTLVNGEINPFHFEYKDDTTGY